MPALTSLAAVRSPMRAVLAAAALLLALVAMLGTHVPTASAASRFTQSPNYICGNGRIAVAPPRVWATRGTEPILWNINLERWNGARWYSYSRSTFYSSFDYFGRQQVAWSMFNTRTGGRFINSRMQMPVYHAGSYRVVSVVAAPGNVGSAVYVGGAGNHCTFG